MRLPFSKPFEMTTSLTADEVARRLRAVVPQFMVFPVPKVWGPVDGRISDHSCVLHLRQTFLKNQVNRIRVLDLKFFTVPEGTLLQGQFRLSWNFWLGIPVSIFVIFFFISMYSSGQQVDAGFGKYFPVAVILWVVGGMIYSVWGSRSAEPQLEDFLQGILGDTIIRGSDNAIVRSRR